MRVRLKILWRFYEEPLYFLHNLNPLDFCEGSFREPGFLLKKETYPFFVKVSVSLASLVSKNRGGVTDFMKGSCSLTYVFILTSFEGKKEGGKLTDFMRDPCILCITWINWIFVKEPLENLGLLLKKGSYPIFVKASVSLASLASQKKGGTHFMKVPCSLIFTITSFEGKKGGG